MGDALLDGEAGTVSVRIGAGGDTSSWAYSTLSAEQAETLPATSIASAWIRTTSFAATVTAIPKLPFASAVPLARTAPAHPESAKSRTTANGSAVPFTQGRVLRRDGEDGIVPVSRGGLGGWSSWMKAMPDGEQADTFPAGSVADA